jgi:hypothetical protein
LLARAFAPDFLDDAALGAARTELAAGAALAAQRRRRLAALPQVCRGDVGTCRYGPI